jgi:RNA exonuclease NGL2
MPISYACRSVIVANARWPGSNLYQEVDRLDKLLPILDSAGYSYTYATGPEKPHGCLIAYRNDMFQSVHAEVVEYDNLQVHHNPEFNPDARIGSSHRTKNIGSIVALQWLGSDLQHKGYIVATTHLFWHPAFVREVMCLI